MTMTSGVRLSEDYQDPQSDVARFLVTEADPGIDSTVSYMRRLPRESPPGSKWHYNTGETNLVGVVLAEAVGMSLSRYLALLAYDTRSIALIRRKIGTLSTTKHGTPNGNTASARFPFLI